MNDAWAVVLGALIALAGSALIPWLREAIEAKQRDRRAQAESRRSAVVELLAANASTAFANGFEDRERLLAAIDARSRAVAELLLAADDGEREELARLVERATPIRSTREKSAYPPRALVFALQATLTQWAARALDASELSEHFDRRLAAFGGEMEPSS